MNLSFANISLTFDDGLRIISVKEKNENLFKIKVQLLVITNR